MAVAATGSATRPSVTRVISRAPASAATRTASASTDSAPSGTTASSAAGAGAAVAAPATRSRAPSPASACARRTPASQSRVPSSVWADREALASRITNRAGGAPPGAAGIIGFQMIAATPATIATRAASRRGRLRTVNSRRL